MKLTAWFSAHPYLSMGLVVSTILLAGTAGFIATQIPEDTSDRVAESRTSASRFANIPQTNAEIPETTQLNEAPDTSPPPPAATAAAAPPAAGFSIACPEAKVVNVQDGDSFTCKVISKNGFSQPVAIKCVNPPQGLDCVIAEKAVTPPPNGFEEFHLGLSNNSVAPGDHSFKVTGTSGATSSSFTFPFDLKAGSGSSNGSGASEAAPNPSRPPAPDFTLVCSSSPEMVEIDSTGRSRCTLTSIGGFIGEIFLRWSPIPDGPILSTAQPMFRLMPGGTAEFFMLIDPQTANPGLYPYTLSADAPFAGLTHSQNMIAHIYGTPKPVPTENPPPAPGG